VLALGCSLLRPLEELETREGVLRAEPCPEDMQEVSLAEGTTFCIDKRETTRDEYEQFLSAPASELSRLSLLQQDPLLCPARGSFEPGGGVDCESAYEPGVDAELPVACVDLCDAMAYCSFRGKRLCGGRGGDTAGEDSANGQTDEWFLACTGATDRKYPYLKYKPGICNVDSAALRSAAELPGCETPDHIEQLSGNVAEWVLVCKESPRRGGTLCLVRGGEYRTADSALAACEHQRELGERVDPPRSLLPTERGAGVGIRCCSD
jgi:formylglycine-generating enzyme required for sulfatase activity